jgi:hypothetical protein
LVEAGTAYVYFGSTSGFRSTAMASLSGNAAEDHVGMSVALAGNVDGAGASDLLIGSPGVAHSASFPSGGSAYLAFGPLTSGTSLEATDLYYDGGDDAAGTRTGTIGDIDDDGYVDFLVGLADTSTYVWLGRP